jgi:SAM-dependent methyltransferase
MSRHAAFDDYADAYEQVLNKGVALSGESPDYFAEGRIDHTASWLQALGVGSPGRVADFGCGVGNSVPHLRHRFLEARLLGLDVSARSIKRARHRHGDTARFAVVNEDEFARDHDLVYCNGVFHHITPDSRRECAMLVYELLVPGGYFALWENNPWNPGTRWVMRRIPFDHDAISLAAPEARSLVSGAGFEVVGTQYCFYFPRALRAFRPLERLGHRVPLGAQYCVLARKPARSSPRG